MDASCAPVPAVDSSTVMVLRDTVAGIEVLMLERHLDSDFVGGAFVFPGGKVDQADVLDVELWSGINPTVEADRMNTAPEVALSLYVAAVRETFEEGGLLFAHRHNRPVTERDLDSDSFKAARARLNSRTESWDWSVVGHPRGDTSPLRHTVLRGARPFRSDRRARRSRDRPLDLDHARASIGCRGRGNGHGHSSDQKEPRAAQ
jgi:8-oxo-dGTP pyrophosphatase MutT (NUDIX family)